MATLLWVSCSVRGVGGIIGGQADQEWFNSRAGRSVGAYLAVPMRKGRRPLGSARGHKGASLKAKPTGPMSAVSPQRACQSGPCTVMVVMRFSMSSGYLRCSCPCRLQRHPNSPTVRAAQTSIIRLIILENVFQCFVPALLTPFPAAMSSQQPVRAAQPFLITFAMH